MAYQTGTATGTADLLDKLNVFAVAAGWTLHRRDTNSLSISKGSVYQNLYEDGAQIRMFLATGYDGGLAWDAQPGSNPWQQMSREMSGSFAAYHFFASGDYIYIVVEVDPGMFKHLAFGKIHKCSAYDGGEFSAAVVAEAAISDKFRGLFSARDAGIGGLGFSPMNTFRLSGVDAMPTWRRLNGDTNASDYFCKSSEYYADQSQTISQLYKDWFVNSPNTGTQQTILIPIHLYVQRPSGLYSPAGYIDDLRLVNMTNINPGEIRMIGANQWLCFPVKSKDVSPSYSYGYAYKIIP
jgi:hypothetical protein